MSTEVNLKWQNSLVSKQEREDQNKQKGVIIWFTGLSGSGKSTLAYSIEHRLVQSGYNAFVLDGDNIRHGLSSDLGFSDTDRTENIRRVSEVAKLMSDAGVIVISAFISPFKHDRYFARTRVPYGTFFEVYCNSSLETCEHRDVKGLYKKARKGLIANFTGIDSDYEVPESPELIVDTENTSIDESVNTVLSMLEQYNIIPTLSPLY